jgi:hypothetical protein
MQPLKHDTRHDSFFLGWLPLSAVFVFQLFYLYIQIGSAIRWRRNDAGESMMQWV